MNLFKLVTQTLSPSPLLVILSLLLALPLSAGGETIPQTDVEAVYSNQEHGGKTRFNTAHEIPVTNLNGVYSSGTNHKRGTVVRIKPGLYELGGMANYSFNDHYLLLDEYVNDPNKFIAVVVPRHIKRNKVDTGYLFQGRPVRGGTAIMLTNLYIDMNGNLTVESQMREDAPHIMLQRNNAQIGSVGKPQQNGRDFHLTGNHPMLEGKIVGVKKSRRRSPQLGMQSDGIFSLRGFGRAGALVSGDFISMGGLSFEMIPVNGFGSSVMALTQSEFNTMGEFDVSEDAISRLVTFVEGCWEEPVLLYFRPSVRRGEFLIGYNKVSDFRSLWEVIAGLFE